MKLGSLLRNAEHEALKTIILSGNVIDLGGEKDSEYRAFIKGDFSVTTLNIDEKAKPDIFHDLEKTLPIQDAAYDHALLINVLEHVFEYKQLLRETFRIVRPNGSAVVIVPFLFPIHPSPNDYRRFTGEALRREFELCGAEEIRIVPLGTGVFTVVYLLFDRLLPYPIRVFNFYTFRFLVILFDYLWQRLAKLLGKRYTRDEYPLGFMVVARVKKI